MWAGCAEGSRLLVPADFAFQGVRAVRVVFLDVDGVVCTPLSLRLSRILRRPVERQCLDPAALFWLRRLVRRSGARIVLSSSWREALTADDPYCRSILDYLYVCLARNGTPVFDAAPVFDYGGKGGEIAAWLEAHSCERYAVLDDHDCFADAPEVRAHWVPIPDSRGLRFREARAALKMLTK